MLTPSDRGQIEQFESQLMRQRGKPGDYRFGFGIVVNPRTGEPFLCCSGEIKQPPHASRFELRRLNGSREGAGSFQEYEDDPCFEPSRISDHPRVHVAEGVHRKGMGNGTALYVCGAVAAYTSSESQNDFSIKYQPDGENLDAKAVCSSPLARSEDGQTCDRTADSSRWWDRAVRHHLAERRENESFEPRSIDDCLDPTQSRELLHRFADDVSDDQDLGEVDVSVCAQGSYEVINRTVIDVLEFEHAVNVNLVIAYTTAPAKFRWQDGLAGLLAPDDAPGARRALDEWDYFNPEAARAVNVGVFREFSAGTEVFGAWMKFCMMNGLDLKDAEAMVNRWRAAMDVQPAAVAREATREQVRANPARRPTPDARLVRRYGMPRRNPAVPPQQLGKALVEERIRLGWSKFFDLP